MVETIKARFLNKNFFTFIPNFALCFVSNDDPVINGHDKAMERRVILVRFLTQFVKNPKGKMERKQDETIKELINSNSYKCAFFTILLQHYKEYIENGKKLSPPKSVLQSTKKFINENNPLKKFMDEMVIMTKDNNDKIASSELYASYMDFHDGNS